VEAGELIARLEACVDSLERIEADHETRLRSLETHRWQLLGALGLIAFAIPIMLHFMR